MSREQWGHGYHAGLEAASDVPERFLTVYDERGVLACVYVILWKRGDEVLLEALDFLTMVMFSNNPTAVPSFEPSDIVPENTVRRFLDEFPSYHLHRSFQSAVGEFRAFLSVVS